ncbi:Two-pore potassium channel 1, partial [Mucuna pruriens]
MVCKTLTRMKVRAQIRLQSQTLLLFAASALAPTFISNSKTCHTAYNLQSIQKKDKYFGMYMNITSIVVLYYGSLFSKFICMANNGVKEPLLLGSLDVTQRDKCQLKKRRLLHSRSAPHTALVPTKTNGNESIPRTAFTFQNLHPSFKRVSIYLAVYLGVGAIIFYLVRNQIKGLKTDGILDAIYFTIVTMTTVGYGDLVPNSNLTKLLACAFVFSGMALVALILSKAADYLVEKQEVLLVKAMRMHQKVGSTEISKEVETNKTRYKFFMVFFLLLILIIVGTIFLVTVEKLEIIDAFYCVCSTFTTLGYGDKSTIILAQLFLYIAELNTESRQKELVKWVLTRKTTILDLEAADLDEDGTVGAAEFVIYKLKEMGKISQEDISLVLQEFEELDVDQSGTLSISDITLAQSS